MKRKTFQRGQEVEFQREAGYNPPWEAGFYRQAEPEPGWHSVIGSLGSRPQSHDVFYVPSRRIREKTNAE
jgi:hypothetical protein